MDSNVYEQFYKMEESNWWFKGTRDVLFNWLKKDLTSNKLKLLDIGCGTGIWLSNLKNYVGVDGLDISKEAIKFCKLRGLDITEGSVEKIPFNDNSFDIVTAIGVIEHLDDDNNVAKEISRVLKPGGKVVILTSAFMSLWSAHDEIVYHKKRYRKKEIYEIFNNNGFELKKLSYFTFFLFPIVLPIRFFQRMINWSPKPEKVTDMMNTNFMINKILYYTLRFEGLLIEIFSLPFGVNIILYGQKK